MCLLHLCSFLILCTLLGVPYASYLFFFLFPSIWPVRASARSVFPSNMSIKAEGLLGDPVFEERENITDFPREPFVPKRTWGTAAERARRNLNAKLSNPLAGFTASELRAQGRNFAIMHEMGDTSDIRAFELGAVLAQAPERYATVEGLTAPEKELLRREFAHRWSQPWKMYAVVALCSLSAAVQGMGMCQPSTIDSILNIH